MNVFYLTKWSLKRSIKKRSCVLARTKEIMRGAQQLCSTEIRFRNYFGRGFQPYPEKELPTLPSINRFVYGAR